MKVFPPISLLFSFPLTAVSTFHYLPDMEASLSLVKACSLTPPLPDRSFAPRASSQFPILYSSSREYTFPLIDNLPFHLHHKENCSSPSPSGFEELALFLFPQARSFEVLPVRVFKILASFSCSFPFFLLVRDLAPHKQKRPGVYHFHILPSRPHLL